MYYSWTADTGRWKSEVHNGSGDTGRYESVSHSSSFVGTADGAARLALVKTGSDPSIDT